MCDCMERAKAALAEHNTRVQIMFALGGNRRTASWPITTVQIDKGRGKPKAIGLLASFCPLCGASLAAAPEVAHG